MADDAAAPDGELTETAKEVQPADEDAAERVDTAEGDAGHDAEAEAEADEDGADDEAEADESGDEDGAPPKAPRSHVSLALIAGLVGVLALAGLVGWLGYRTYESHRAEEQRNVFLQVGRQGALNLTTIGYETADADVQRILDSATGSFYDEFQQRAEPFVEVVKQAQSKSVGTIAEAGIESASENEAQVLVAVTVQTTNAGAPEQQPRAWRMRISVQDIDGDAKVSNVEFVP
ncbi:hypothetical protein [Mycolicibacterium iranicum]|uniref:Mce protein n=1 Tax=Mycolicibacterium iranicum TaxID=912594 RepID=A0A1X1WKI4_MYCIR|nr:hypothetical protein [Mycolicibacterium iranicum]MCZ0730760.1 Mce protein [Mycolicibacterium iranicum]ORV87111.1 Mce protein [Mycolicibacterium iranicum]